MKGSFNKLVAVALLALTAAASFATTAYGLRASGFLYEIDDQTGATTFSNDIGSGTWAGLASQDSSLFSVQDNLRLMKFTPGGTATFVRNLNFIGTNELIDIAIDGQGVGWAAIKTAFGTDVWKFGLAINETFQFKINSGSISAIAFGNTGSLYAWNALADLSKYGLHVVNQNDGSLTKVGTSTRIDNVNGMGIRPGLGGFSNYCGAFNEVAKGSTFDDNSQVLSTPNLGFIAVDYLGSVPNAITATVGTISLGVLNQFTTGCLDDVDGNSLKLCKGFVPNLTSPIIRFEVSAHVPTGALTISLTETCRMSTAGSFLLICEMLDPSTNTFSPLYNRVPGLAKSFFAANVPLNLLDANNNVKFRFSVIKKGFSASSTPCVEFDQIVVTKTP